jgi:hypothetical protein
MEHHINSTAEIKEIAHFQTLLARYRPLKTVAAAFERRESPDFNLFELLGLERQEWVHSAFLKDLLDPRGSHAQGDLFLRVFLKHCQSKHPEFPNLLKMCQGETGIPRVYAEVPTGLGRPDLVILLEHEFAFIIENKIDAAEGQDQIKRYREWLGNQREARTGEIVLVYLTPCPLDSSVSLPDKCFTLSYKDDITAWIERSIDDKGLESEQVRHSLRQYLKSIKNLCTEEALSKATGQSTLGKFISENRQDIFDLWQAFKRELGDPRVAFWTKLAARIREVLASKGSGRWNVTLNSEDPGELSRRNAGRVFVISNGSDTEHLYCYFLVQEYAGRLEYGIVWSEELTPKREQEVLAASKELVSLRGDLGKQDFKRHSWWVALKRVADLDLDETRVVADLYSGDHLQRLLADKVLDLFDQAAGRVRKINDTLAKKNL